MVRHGLAWLTVVPLAAIGALGAHESAYRLLGAGGEGVHGYLAHLPQLLAALSVLAALGAGLTTRRGRAPAAWPFAAVALGGFAVQEHVERLVHTGELPLLVTWPVFLLGLALQLPFALAAYLVARALLHVAQALAEPHATPRLAAPPMLLPAAVAAVLPARPLHLLGRPLRGPPAA